MSVELIVAGDAIPQVKVLANAVADVMAGAPSCWNAADARILNLEAPIGDREALPGDKSLLAYAAPPSWFADLYAATRANALVVANNHACDLGAEGLARTVSEAQKLSAPIAGADKDDPFRRLDVVEKGGRHVCLVAWTTFVNDKGKKAKLCVEGAAGAKLARAELGHVGEQTIERELGAPHRWDGCDARIAYLHGGREYQGQIRPLMEQATAAAAYVDAVIISHPHVPDGVAVVSAPAGKGDGARPPGRLVPVWKSLGNFISNQGVGWTAGMSGDIVETNGQPDPIRTVWTRVSLLARLAFDWPAGAPAGAIPSIRYGYSLAFMERSTPADDGPGKGKDPGFRAALSMRLRPLPSGGDDPIAKKLGAARAPFGPLLSGPCLLGAEEHPRCAPTAASP